MHFQYLFSINVSLFISAFFIIGSQFLHFLFHIQINNWMFFRQFNFICLLMCVIFWIDLIFINKTILNYNWFIGFLYLFCLFFYLIWEFVNLLCCDGFWYYDLLLLLLCVYLNIFKIFGDIYFLFGVSFFKH